MHCTCLSPVSSTRLHLHVLSHAIVVNNSINYQKHHKHLQNAHAINIVILLLSIHNWTHTHTSDLANHQISIRKQIKEGRTIPPKCYQTTTITEYNGHQRAALEDVCWLVVPKIAVDILWRTTVRWTIVEEQVCRLNEMIACAMEPLNANIRLTRRWVILCGCHCAYLGGGRGCLWISNDLHQRNTKCVQYRTLYSTVNCHSTVYIFGYVVWHCCWSYFCHTCWKWVVGTKRLAKLFERFLLTNLIVHVLTAKAFNWLV